MDRTVPKTGGEEIGLYMRTYYSLLRSTDIIQIETLEESHKAVESSLHVKARLTELDIAALTYSTLRLPAQMPNVDTIVIGQLEKSFADAGYGNVEKWVRVNAPGRRRRVHYDGKNTLAVFIASRSDIDDIVPILTAYQIEWNKLHNIMRSAVAQLFLNQNQDSSQPISDTEVKLLADTLQISYEDMERLVFIWQPEFRQTLQKVAEKPKRIGLRLLSSSLADYHKATAYWWDELREEGIEANIDPRVRPVYFVSSNTHSLPNLLTGFAWRNKDSITQYVEKHGDEILKQEYAAIRTEKHTANVYNFLYYSLKKYVADNSSVEKTILNDERSSGIYRVLNKHGFQVGAQIIDVAKLQPDWFDPRLCDNKDYSMLAKSDALIINIDYPLGLAAYELLSHITSQVGSVLGVYIMGKAATLNGRVGDVMIPNVVHDEHSENTYLYNNCFAAHDVTPYISYGMVLDNQKAISAPGTFLQNSSYMSVFYKEGYTDIEMEGGPYLSAIYEAYRPKRHPHNEIVNLHGVPFDVGFLHYASDTPFGRAHNLGTSNLSYAGVDPTYATAIAILRRILEQEAKRIQAKE